MIKIFSASVLMILLFTSCKKGCAGHTPAVDSILINGDFETDQKETQTPSGWLSSGNDTDADYIEGGGHTGTYALTHKKSAAYQVKTYQTLTGMKNGYYKLTAFVQNSGRQNACYLSGEGGGIENMTSLPVSDQWTAVTVRGIHVTDGKCTVSIYSDANADNWCKVDDIVLIKDDVPYTFLKGGDVSELDYIESKGGKFYENGVEKDCFQILKDNGFNIVRLRALQ